MKRLKTALTKIYNKKGTLVRKNVLYQSVALLLFCTIVAGLFPVSAQAASLAIRYDKKDMKYTGAQTKITVDGQSVKMETPGILINNTNMVYYADVFKRGLKAKTSYDSAKKKLVIKLNDITVEMKNGSKTASVNGKNVTLDQAPRFVYFDSVKKTKLYVPAGSVAKALGCSYVWNNSSLTGQITSPYVIKMDGKWTVYTGVKGKVTYNGQNIDVSSSPGIVKDGTMLVSAARVFNKGIGTAYKYDSKTGQITISQGDVKIVMTKNTRKATVNGVSKTLATAPRVITYKTTGKSNVMVPAEFVATALGYDYKWNSATGTSAIEKKQEVFFHYQWDSSSMELPEDANMLTSLKAVTNNTAEQLILESRFPVTPVVTQDLDNACIYVDIAGIHSEENIISEMPEESDYIYEVNSYLTEEGIRFTLCIEPDSEYYMMTSGKTITLVVGNTEKKDADDQMKIPMPEKVKFADIKTEDHYEKNYFTIEVPGNQVQYYKSNPVVFNSDMVSGVSCALNNAGNTVIKVQTYELQGFRLSEKDGFIGVRIGRPAEIYRNIVVLDAGHGGSDPGTSKGTTKEKDLTLKMIYSLAEKYFNRPDSPVKAYWTRKEDTAVALNDRAAFADKVDADFFISFHINSAASTSAKGMEVLYAKRNENYMGTANSKTIATEYADYLIKTLNMDGRLHATVDRPNLVVLYKNKVPAILIELGFISNASDYKKMVSSDFQDKTAKAIYDATVKLFEKYPTGR